MKEGHFDYRAQLLNRIAGGLLGGAVAGSLLGFIEAWAIIAKNWETVHFSILPYATILYTLICGLQGLGLGIVLALMAIVIKRRRSMARVFAFMTPLMFSINAIILTRYRVFRDVMKEKPIPSWGMLVILLSASIILVVSYIVLRRVARQVPDHVLFKPIGAGGLVVALIVTALIGSVVFNRLKHQTEPPPSRTAQEANAAQPNVLLIMIDALRADFLGCYGHPKNLSPHIDQVAMESVLFENTFSQSSWTRPSTATIFTSLYPSTHQTYRKPDILPGSVVTLAEVLADNGYYCVGYANNINIAPKFNFQQGFHEYHYLAPDYFFFASADSSQLGYYGVLRLIRERFLFKDKKVNHYYQDAEVLNKNGIQWLEENQSKGRFFMFMHYMETHDPYFRHPYDGTGYARVSMGDPAMTWREPFIEAYESEVQFVDQHLGKLFDRLRAMGLYDQTMIVITADHGEEFYEHKGWWHGTSLYDEQIKVPLIIKLPESDLAGRRVDGLARLLDIAPTIFGRIGIPKPETMQGHLLLPPFSIPMTTDAVFAEEDFEGNVIKILRTRDWKLLRSNEGNPRGLPPAELYDLSKDPGEMQNLYNNEYGKVLELDPLLKSHIDEAYSKMVAREQTDIDEELRAQLETLGYAAPGRSDGDQEDDGEAWE
ncbi:sulfatase-like hydrolase/transferase [bacterium]|nr:sulfatase-like hydrolase/transferase [candidate division CSSED10-310 bacterium]